MKQYLIIPLAMTVAGCPQAEVLSGKPSDFQRYYETRIASLEARISDMETAEVATKVDVKPVAVTKPVCSPTFRVSYCDEHGQEIFYE